MLRTANKRLYLGASLRDILAGGYPDYGHVIGNWLDICLINSPLAAYRFQEASGNPQDSSGNGNHITSVSGTPLYQETGFTPVGSYSAKLEVNEQFSRAIVSSVTNNLTMEMVIKRSGTGTTNHSIYACGNPSTNGYGILWSGTGGKFRLILPNIGFQTISTGEVSTSDFTIVHVIRRNGTWEYWIDGIADNLAVSTSNPSAAPTGNMVFGRSDNTANAWFGWAAFYDSALNENDIVARAAFL